MRAAMFVETGGPLVIEDVEPTAPGPRDLIVQLGASGVCHSDLSIKNGYVPIMPGSILGHEGAGIVIEVGSEVRSVVKGDKVIASFIPACGVCVPCLNDHTHLCDSEIEVMMAMRGSRPGGDPYMAMTGLGTFAETMTVSESSVVKVVPSVENNFKKGSANLHEIIFLPGGRGHRDCGSVRAACRQRRPVR